MSTPIDIHGFEIRSPVGDEIAVAWLLLGVSKPEPVAHQLFVAFGQPGNVPLGAAVVYPAGGGRTGMFAVHVRPEARRLRIGTRLAQAVYRLALANHAERLSPMHLIGPDNPASAFCLSIGLRQTSTLDAYTLELSQVVDMLTPITRRFDRSAGETLKIVRLDDLEPERIVEFVASNYHGRLEQTRAQLAAGRFDLAISAAVVRPIESRSDAPRASSAIEGLTLIRSAAGVPSIFLELVLVSPAYRATTLPGALMHASATRAVADGRTRVVFEADSGHDDFAVRFAARHGVTPQSQRHRYAITTTEMEIACADDRT